MRRLIFTFLGTGATAAAFAHELGSTDGLLHAVHAASSPHHWAGLLILIGIAALLAIRFGRRQSRSE